MNKVFIILFFTFPLVLAAQDDSIAGKVYTYKKPATSVNNIASAILFKGSTYDLSSVEMSSNIIAGNTKMQFQHAAKECLLIVKSGTLSLSMKDSLFSLYKGCIALIIPEETCWIQHTSNEPCEFYIMTYTSRMPEDGQRGLSAGGSAVIEWNNVVFTPHDKGGIRRFFNRPTAMLQHFEIHESTLKAGLKSHDPHTHRAAEIIMMVDGHTEMQIGDNLYKGNTGDVYYLPSNVPHAIRNDSKTDCMYFAFQFQ